MKCVISKPQFILLVTYVILIAHTLAEPSEEAKNGFLAWRQRYHEARLSARTTRQLIATDDVFANDDSGNWAGAVQIAPSANQSFTSITGEWTIPSVSLPTGPLYPNNDYNMGEWVGIDGWTGSRCDDVIFQAGVYSFIRTDDNGTEFDSGVLSWFEWFPETANFFTNYSVAVGDRIQVTLLVNSPAEAQVTFSDPDYPGDELTITVPAPNNTFLICGGSAEWILEDTQAEQYPGSLLNFGTTSMVNCSAGLVQGDTIEDVTLDGATLIDLYENYEDGPLLVNTTTVSSTELAFLYAGSS